MRTKRLTISEEAAITARVVLQSRLADLRRNIAEHPDSLTRQWLTELEEAYDELTLKLFGAEYLQRNRFPGTREEEPVTH